MKETSPNPSGEPKPWMVGIVRLLRLVNLGVMEWTRLRIAKLRLSGFALRRSEVGKKLALWIGKLRFLAARFTHHQGEQIHAIGRSASAVWNLASFALSPLVWAAFAIAATVGVPILYERLATSRGWTPLPMPAQLRLRLSPAPSRHRG